MNKPKTRKQWPLCHWLRQHSASMKPARRYRISGNDGRVYLVLTNGQIINELTARRMEV
jgi:hypothetical protein